MISSDDLSKLGMPTSSLKVIHPKTGVEGYRVGVEAFHQLHCINLLRRVTYKTYYEPFGGEFEAGPEVLKMHTGMLPKFPEQDLHWKSTRTVLTGGDRSLFGGSSIKHTV